MIKVSKGTPQHSASSLCRSCRHATVVLGTRIDEEIIQCDALSSRMSRVRFKVTECSSYDDSSRPSLDSMQMLAWELRTDKSGRRIGFMSPRDARVRAEELEPVEYIERT